MKVFLVVFSLALILGGLGLFAYQFFFLSRSSFGALQVTSVPQSKVYLDDKYIGDTPLCKCGQISNLPDQKKSDMLPVGNYTIRIVPKNEKFAEFEEHITIERSVLTVVDRKFGQIGLSEGSIISLTPLQNKDQTALTVVTVPDSATLLVDESEKGKTPIALSELTESDHALLLQKQNYKSKTVRIRVTKGYKLTAKIFLSLNLTPDQKKKEEASASAQVAKKTTVRILQTGTGFLRVREDNSLSAKEVTRVNPGETFELLEEAEGWFQIKLTDGRFGWISSEYAQKEE